MFISYQTKAYRNNSILRCQLNGYVGPVLLVAAMSWITATMFMEVFSMAAETLIMVRVRGMGRERGAESICGIEILQIYLPVVFFPPTAPVVHCGWGAAWARYVRGWRNEVLYRPARQYVQGNP